MIILRGMMLNDQGNTIVPARKLDIARYGYASFTNPVATTHLPKTSFLMAGVGAILTSGGGTGKSTFVRRLKPDILLVHGEREANSFDTDVTDTSMKVVIATTQEQFMKELDVFIHSESTVLIADSPMRYMTAGSGDAASSGGYNWDLAYTITDLSNVVRPLGKTIIFVLNARKDDDQSQTYLDVLNQISSASSFVIQLGKVVNGDWANREASIIYAHDNTPFRSDVFIPRPVKNYIDLNTMTLKDSSVNHSSRNDGDTATLSDIKNVSYMSVIDSATDIAYAALDRVKIK